MRIRHLLFFLAPFCLSGCFAAYIPAPEHVENLNQTMTYSDSGIIAFSLERTPPRRRSLGHQYLFPGIPVTSLYFERDLNDVLGEYLLYHPKLGRGARAVTNLLPTEILQLFGPKANVFRINVEGFSTSGQDYFFLRKAMVDGRIGFSLNNLGPQSLEFNSSRYISKATVEVLSELIEESLYNSLEEVKFRSASHTSSGGPAPQATIICISQKPNLENSCLSKKNISIGIENYFKRKELSFVSFRDGCPSSMPVNGFFLMVNADEIEDDDLALKISTSFVMHDLGGPSGSASLINSRHISKEGKLISSSSEPDCAAVRQTSEALAEEFFAQ